jgi:hypothetical protein
MTPSPPSPEASALEAARHALQVAGDEVADGGARQDAFAALLYGIALGAEAGREAADDRPQLTERVADLAVRLLRDAVGATFRDASRTVEAIGDALAADEPDAAVIGLVREGLQCVQEWLGGDRRAFESRVMRATGEAYASARALRPR